MINFKISYLKLKKERKVKNMLKASLIWCHEQPLQLMLADWVIVSDPLGNCLPAGRRQRTVDQLRLPLVYPYHNAINPLPPTCLFHIDPGFHITDPHISFLNPLTVGLFVFMDCAQGGIFFSAQFWMKLFPCFFTQTLKSFFKIPSILLFAGPCCRRFLLLM